MPIFMDVHLVPGVKAKGVAEAHQLDLLIQEHHGCKCMTYWIDEKRESVFCLIEAPRKEAVEELHAKAHGLVPSRIIEVDTTLVESFLGRIYDPSEATIADDGIKVFHDPSFRFLLITTITDPALLRYRLGEEKTGSLLDSYKEITRRNLKVFNGSEVEHESNDFVVSFTSASNAVACALNIRDEMSKLDDAAQLDFRVVINGGEPVQKSNFLFGDTIRFAGYMRSFADNFRVAVSSCVKEIVSKDHFYKQGNKLIALSQQDENLLELLFAKLEEHWQDSEFDIDEYCQATTMSKSQLYRKCVEFTGMSPNQLLKDFRLEKAKQLMNKKRYNISQITFDSGFTSPSYFTKCFKKKYGLLPMAYVDLLH